MRRPLILMLSLSVLAAACSTSSDEAVVAADEAPVETVADTDDTTGTAGDDAPFDYSTVDYDGETTGNALFGDRYNPAFPPAVVPVDELLRGGPPPDGIPAINLPQFVSIEDATFMETDEEAIVVVTVEGETKGYPIRIMTWHEIVNDVFGEVPVTVTYCPLCNSALAYDRRFGDRVLDFGTSGELYQSAMVMYDRQTQSLWSHFLGQGIIGHYAGAQLDFIPAQTLSWGVFREAHPEALVLDQNATGFERSYGANPYVGYDDEFSRPYPGFVTQDIDDRLPPKARILGVTDDKGSVAVEFATLAEAGVVAIDEDGRNLIVFHQDGLASALETGVVSQGTDVGQTGVFVAAAPDGRPLTFSETEAGFVDNETGSLWSITGRALDGELSGSQLTAVSHVDSFWFAWSIYQPDTSIVTG